MYKEMADVYEKIVQLPLYLKNFEKNKLVDVDNAIKLLPKNIIDQLTNENYQLFTDDYNRTIRNSINHRGYQKLMSRKSIIFTDIKRELECNTKTLYIHLRHLFSLNLTILSIPHRIYLREVRLVKKDIESSMKKYGIMEKQLDIRVFS